MLKNEAYPYRQIGSRHCGRSKLAKYAAASSETCNCRLVFPTHRAASWVPQKRARLLLKVSVWENALRFRTWVDGRTSSWSPTWKIMSGYAMAVASLETMRSQIRSANPTSC